MGSTLGFGKHLCHCFWHSAQPGVCCTFSPLAIQSEGHGWTQTPCEPQADISLTNTEPSSTRGETCSCEVTLRYFANTTLHCIPIWQGWAFGSFGFHSLSLVNPRQLISPSNTERKVTLIPMSVWDSEIVWQVFVSFCRQALLFACRTPGCIHSELVALIWLGHPSSLGPHCPPWVKCSKVRTTQVELSLSFGVTLWSFLPLHSDTVSPGT